MSKIKLIPALFPSCNLILKHFKIRNLNCKLIGLKEFVSLLRKYITTIPLCQVKKIVDDHLFCCVFFVAFYSFFRFDKQNSCFTKPISEKISFLVSIELLNWTPVLQTVLDSELNLSSSIVSLIVSYFDDKTKNDIEKKSYFIRLGYGCNEFC